MDAYQCRACGAGFESEHELHDHVTSAHGETEMPGRAGTRGGVMHACELCDELFQTREDLERHRLGHAGSEAA